MKIEKLNGDLPMEKRLENVRRYLINSLIYKIGHIMATCRKHGMEEKKFMEIWNQNEQELSIPKKSLGRKKIVN
jgi:hypothetical protein